MGSTDQTNPIEKLSAETAASWCRKLSAATPSGGGEWTPDYLHSVGIFTTEQMCDAHNATLRDCGNDAKRRLDNALMALRALADCDHRTGATQIRIIVREALLRDAAMLETGEQTKENP